MIRLYLDTNEFVLGDMLLNAAEFSNLNFICNNSIDGVDEERVDMGQNYGFDVHYDIGFFKDVKSKIEVVLKSASNVTLCIDHLHNWLVGVNPNGNTLEDMYSEYQIDDIRNTINRLIQASNKHDISILCNEYVLQYVIDTVHMNNYVIID